MTFEKIISFGSSFFVHGALLSITYIIAIFMIAKITQSFIRKAIDRFEKRSNRKNGMIFVMADRIVKYVIYTLALILTIYEFVPFKTFGSALVGLSSVITVTVALATQEFAGNLVSGAVISAYEPFKVGDLIKLPEKEIIGTIEDMNFRHVLIRSLDNSMIIIPNKMINQAIVENRAGEENGSLRNVFNYDIAYGSDIELARHLIVEYLEAYPAVRKDETISVSVESLGSTSVLLRVVCYTNAFGEGFDLKLALNEYVLKVFPENGIEIPYPYLNVINK